MTAVRAERGSIASVYKSLYRATAAPAGTLPNGSGSKTVVQVRLRRKVPASQCAAPASMARSGLGDSQIIIAAAAKTIADSRKMWLIDST